MRADVDGLIIHYIIRAHSKSPRFLVRDAPSNLESRSKRRSREAHANRSKMDAFAAAAGERHVY